jgi:hypothetical protein
MQKNKTKTIYQIKTLFIVLIVFCSFTVLNISFAQSFIGPSCAAGLCQGKIGVDSSGNVSMGTSTPQSGTKTLIISQTSDSSSYGLRVLSSNNSPLFLVRSDGKISIATSGASYALTVSGDIYASGNLVVGGTFSAPIPAGNVTPGVFNSLQGGGTGAYAFLGSLGIATSSQVGLPQSLSVYGGGYFSGNVGIGTTGPGAKLEVAGSVAATGAFLIGTGINYVGRMGVDGGTYISVDTYNGTNFTGRDLYLRGNTVSIHTGSGPTQRLTVDSSGNVGIGVTSPSGKLEIGGTEAADEPRLIFAASDASDRFTIKTDLDAITSNDLLGFRSVGVDNILVLKGNGNVGIGTTTPAYKLDVVGQINSSGGLCIAGDCKTSWSQVGGSSQWTNTTGGIYYLGNVGIGTSTVSYPLFVSTSTDTLFAIQRTGASSPTIFKQGTDAGFVINNGGSDILTIKSGSVGIGTTNPGARLHLRGTQGNLVVNTESVTNSIAIEAFNDGNTVKYPILLNPWGGNVGIGTTNPGTNALKVVGDLGVSTDGSTTGVPRVAAFVDLSSGEAARFQFGDPYNAFQNVYNGRLQIYSYWGIELIGSRQSLSSPSFVTGAANDPSVSILSPAAARNVLVVRGAASQTGDLQQWQDSAGTVLAVVKAGGNVGIGTTTPAYKLDVVGQINSSGGLCIAGDCKTSWSQVGGSSQWTNTTGGIYYLGNVGIGTSTVSYPLFVSTSTDTLFAIQRTGASSPTIFKQGTDAGFVINNGGSDILTIKSGSVGIGTTNPAYKLDVLDSSALVTYPLRLNNAYGGTTDLDQVGIMFSVHDGRPFATITGGQQNSGTYAYGRLDFGTRTDDTNGVQTKMSILSDGNVGIGTTTPGSKLHIEGGEVRIKNANGNFTHFNYAAGSTNYIRGVTYFDNASAYFTGGNVGIGTTTPAYKLDVASGGSVTARFGTASSDTVIIGGGAGKINVGTVDPIYSIGGKKYATYGPESIGVKVGHTGVLKLVLNKNKYEGVLDFKNAKDGDDLWLFAKTTNLASNFDKLTIQLTPAFKGKVWYNKDKENMIVKIYGEVDELNNNELEVSYSLSAPRFDSEKWPNYSNDETVEGIKIY